MLPLVLRRDELGPPHKNILRGGGAAAPTLENFLPASARAGKSSGLVGRGEAGAWPEEKLGQLPALLPGGKMVLLSRLYWQMQARTKKWQLEP